MINVPFSSGDSIKHPPRPATITVFSPLGGSQGKASCFGRKGDPRTTVRPKHATPRGVAAWPRRHSPLLDCPGLRPPGRNPALPGFWQRFPYRYGPARVGLGPRFQDPHRLRLSSLIMTTHAPLPFSSIKPVPVPQALSPLRRSPDDVSHVVYFVPQAAFRARRAARSSPAAR